MDMLVNYPGNEASSNRFLKDSDDEAVRRVAFPGNYGRLAHGVLPRSLRTLGWHELAAMETRK